MSRRPWLSDMTRCSELLSRDLEATDSREYWVHVGEAVQSE